MARIDPLRLLSVLLAAVLAVLGSSDAAAQGGPLETAIHDHVSGLAGVSLAERTRDAGASGIRVAAEWHRIAPATRAPGFVESNPDSPGYDWTSLDQQVSVVAGHALEPLVRLGGSPPEWALTAPAADAPRTLPDPAAFGRFAEAAARRYDGTNGRPRVRIWLLWNEPNLTPYIRPQFRDGVPFSPHWYRRMVNEAADRLKAVRADNVVVAGNTAPFNDLTPEAYSVDPLWGPLKFMREFLCLSAALEPTCQHTVRFDVWGHHPYTSGGPTRQASSPDSVSIGDLHKMRRVLEAGWSRAKIVADEAPAFWATEFSWDSDPPDPLGVPTDLLTRWVAEALFRMWSDGVSLVMWFTMRDSPYPASLYQAGLYFRGATTAEDVPKAHLQAFRFPFVAFAGHDGLDVWGRTPGGRQATVLVQQRFAGGWADRGTLASDEFGIVQGRVPGVAHGLVRARTVDRGEEAAPFSPRPEPDRTFLPFGGGALEPEPPSAPPPPPPPVPERPAGNGPAEPPSPAPVPERPGVGGLPEHSPEPAPPVPPRPSR